MQDFLKSRLWSIGKCRDMFKRDQEIDALDCESIALMMKNEPQHYSEEELLVLETVSENFSSFAEETMYSRIHAMNSPDPQVDMLSMSVAGSPAMMGKAVAVFDATPEECAAWEWATMSRCRCQEHFEFDGSIARGCKKINDHAEVFNTVFDTQIPGFLPREWLDFAAWRVHNSDLHIAFQSTFDDDFKENVRYVRVMSSTLMSYERLPNVGDTPQTRATYNIQSDLMGYIPVSIINTRGVQALMYLSIARKRFDKTNEVDSFAMSSFVKKNAGILNGSTMPPLTEDDRGVIKWAIHHVKTSSIEPLWEKTLATTSPLSTNRIFKYKATDHNWMRLQLRIHTIAKYETINTFLNKLPKFNDSSERKST